jgi:hypothetical protein
VHGTPYTGEDGLVDGIYAGMAIESLRNKVTFFIGSVTLAGKVKTGMTHALQDGRPFGGFEGNTIGTCKPCRDKSDAS